MKWKLMVPTIGIATVIIGMMTIFPYAMGEHQKDFDDDKDDENKCNKRFYQAIKEYDKKGYIPVGIKHKVLDCLEDGFISPWELPGINTDTPSPNLTGLAIEFVETPIDIPLMPRTQIREISPCPSGKIVFGEMELQSVDINVILTVNLLEDKATVIFKTTNNDSVPDTVVLVAPCLGLIGS